MKKQLTGWKAIFACMVTHSYQPSTGEVEAEGSEDEGHSQPHSNFEASLGYIKTLFQKWNNRANTNDKTLTIKHPTLKVHRTPARRSVSEKQAVADAGSATNKRGALYSASVSVG